MVAERTRLKFFYPIALCILLCYPIMAIKWIPFGGGARYLSVLAGPISLVLLFLAPRNEIRPLLLSACRWALPFLPFVLAWIFAQVWHANNPMDATPLSRLFWCAVLFLGARLAGISYRHLAIAAGIGAIGYGLVAFVEVYGLGRERAWGEPTKTDLGNTRFGCPRCVACMWCSPDLMSARAAWRIFFSAPVCWGLSQPC